MHGLTSLNLPPVESLLRESGAAAVAAGMLYLACVLLAIGLYRKCAQGSRQRFYWLVVSSALMSAGIIEALGLPAKVTQMMRAELVAQGWYATRWGIQIEFVIALFAVCLAGSIMLKPLVPPDRGAAAVFRSLGMLLAFIAIRSVSVHELDALLRMNVAGRITLNNFLEGGLLLLVLWRLLFAHRMCFDTTCS